MAFVAILPNGLGESLGDSIAVNAPFYSTGMVWYVDSENGTDAVAPAGRNRSSPLAGLEQAQTNAAAGDTIVLMDGHSEPDLELNITKRLLIVGAGSSDGLPTATLGILHITADGVELRNVRFNQHSEADSTAHLDVAASRFRGVGLYFAAGANDEGTSVELSTEESSIEFVGCTWVSVSTTTQPDAAVRGGNVALTHLTFRECIFDGGSTGYSNHWALDLIDSTVTDLRIENITLLRGADVRIANSATCYVAGITSTESAVIDFVDEPGGG